MRPCGVGLINTLLKCSNEYHAYMPTRFIAQTQLFSVSLSSFSLLPIKTSSSPVSPTFSRGQKHSCVPGCTLP